MSSTEILGPWRFRLVRKVDETGVSGTGHIADGVRFQDGTCAMRWRSATKSTAVYGSHDDLMQIHGHGGKTECEWIDRLPSAPFLRGAENCQLDAIENAPFSSAGGPESRASLKAPHYIKPEDAAEYLRGYAAEAQFMYGDDWQTCQFGWSPALTLGAEARS